MTTRDDLLGIVGYSAEVCEPDSKPVAAFYTDRHLSPILDRLVEYVEQVRADERERTKTELRATAKWCREDERATMRAQVEALPSAYIVAGVWVDARPSDDDEWGDKPAVLRADVLALIGGSDD